MKVALCLEEMGCDGSTFHGQIPSEQAPPLVTASGGVSLLVS
jgi:hypothetical protein